MRWRTVDFDRKIMVQRASGEREREEGEGRISFDPRPAMLRCLSSPPSDLLHSEREREREQEERKKKEKK
jgi:hypothetical protein